MVHVNHIHVSVIRLGWCWCCCLVPCRWPCSPHQVLHVSSLCACVRCRCSYPPLVACMYGECTVQIGLEAVYWFSLAHHAVVSALQTGEHVAAASQNRGEFSTNNTICGSVGKGQTAAVSCTWWWWCCRHVLHQALGHLVLWHALCCCPNTKHCSGMGQAVCWRIKPVSNLALLWRTSDIRCDVASIDDHAVDGMWYVHTRCTHLQGQVGQVCTGTNRL